MEQRIRSNENLPRSRPHGLSQRYKLFHCDYLLLTSRPSVVVLPFGGHVHVLVLSRRKSELSTPFLILRRELYQRRVRCSRTGAPHVPHRYRARSILAGRILESW
jgi:hypothetical protein